MTFRGTTLAVALLAAAALLASCGGNDDGNAGSSPPPSARVTDFPNPAGMTIADLRGQVGPGPVLSPAVSVLEAGQGSRFAFGLFDRSHKQISQAQVALYVADENGRKVQGPVLAKWESLAVKPEFQSESVTADPDAARSLYVAKLPFGRPGVHQVLGIAKLDGRLVAADPIAVEVFRDTNVPEPGDEAPRIHTPTLEDVGGAIERIDTRRPPAPDLHETDFADVVGKEPVILIFATPALCQSRVCGPVVDIVKQVKGEHPGEATFIHMEVFRDNEIEKGYRKEFLAWNLPTEPWVFAIDRTGKVAARLEGGFSAAELEQALAAATRR